MKQCSSFADGGDDAQQPLVNEVSSAVFSPMIGSPPLMTKILESFETQVAYDPPISVGVRLSCGIYYDYHLYYFLNSTSVRFCSFERLLN